MGLAATQMRFLLVTARKSNVEYQGQQINQSRSVLANQSADIATELGNLKAPTAPSKYKYILNPVSEPNIDWSAEVPSINADDFEAYYAATRPDFADFDIPQYQEEVDADGNATGNLQLISYDANGKKQLGTAVDPSTIQGIYCYTTTGNKYTGDVTNTITTEETTTTTTSAAYKSVKYSKVVVPDDEIYYYNAETNEFKPKDGYEVSDLPTSLQYFNLASSCYTGYSATKSALIYENQPDDPDEATASGVELTATNSATDAQYAAAYAQYEIDLQEYEAAYAELEAKTDEIQEIDKKLELQLKELETEREEINTEWEALQKVVSKNIEQTYKAFNA